MFRAEAAAADFSLPLVELLSALQTEEEEEEERAEVEEDDGAETALGGEAIFLY